MPGERVVWGPPGCGKTTAGILLASHWTGSGVRPNQIAYLAFTRAAAKEASLRIFETEDDTRIAEEYTYFRTIHSLCFGGISSSGSRPRLISDADMRQFAKESGLEGAYVSANSHDLGEAYRTVAVPAKTEWDLAHKAYQFSRLKARSGADLSKAAIEPSDEGAVLLGLRSMAHDVYPTFVGKYERFKEAEGLIDFTDMLEFGLLNMPPIEDVRYVIIDEAQDLSPIHFAIIDHLFSDAEEIWWLGDDDQAVHQWCGASPALFLERSRRARRQIQLRQTHRFGQKIVDFSSRIIHRVQRRHPKEAFSLIAKEGRIIESGRFNPESGDIMILHRHVDGCQKIAYSFMDAGIPFRNERGWDPLSSIKRIKVWQTVRALSQGETVSPPQVERLVEEALPEFILGGTGERIRLLGNGALSKSQKELKGPVSLPDLVQAKILTLEGAAVIAKREYDILAGARTLQYYERLAKNGFAIDDAKDIPRITTIHGSKGRQAAKVVIFPEMGGRCSEDLESEHRLAYVAATRTKSDLEICYERMVHWARDSYGYPISESGRGPEKDDAA